ncbi:MAG: hypothetical protein ACK4SY_03125 [Pyrobaculum sp.]
MESFKNFVINYVDRILEYLKQNPLVIYARRSVDAYMSAYALAVVFGETTQVSVVDWPPPGGVCIGFKCGGFYITEREVGVEGERHVVDFTSLSHLTALVIQTLAPLEEVRKALYIGHYAWSVDHCDYRCLFPKELMRGDERLAVVFPHLYRLPIRRAMSLSTLPIIPGVTGRLSELKQEDALSALDWALGVVATEGFHTAVLDKAIRPLPPDFNPADYAQRVEADLAGFLNKDVEQYVSNLAETFYAVLKKERIATIQNPSYIYKLPPYLAHYLKLPWLVLKYESARGVSAAVIPPLERRGRLKALREAFEEVGQVLEYPTHLLVFMEPGRFGDFLKIYDRE